MTAASRPALSGIEDALALILECGNDLLQIEAVLLPALKKLCNTYLDENGASGSSNRKRQAHQGPSQEIVLCHPIQGNVDPLTALDPATHTVGMIYILAARTNHAVESAQDAAVLLPHINAFIQHFSILQARLAPEKITPVAAGLSKIGDLVADPEAALHALQALFSRFVTRADNLTTLHPILAYQYVKTRRYAEAATMLLDLPLIDANTSITPLKYTDVLEYFYYSGLVYLKLERYAEAIDSFETCISSPAVAVSAIHMDAYKKLILAQLLAHGKTLALPKYVPQTITRTFKQIAQPYLAFATAYESRNPDCVQEVQSVVRDRHETFSQDRNLGLVHKCVAMHRQRRIQRLQEVYSALSIAGITQLLGESGPEAERETQRDVEVIIRKRWINAQIDQSSQASSTDPSTSPVVLFSPGSWEKYNSAQSIDRLTKEINVAKQWQGLVHQREREIARSQAYLLRAQKMRDSRYAAFGSSEDYEESEY